MSHIQIRIDPKQKKVAQDTLKKMGLTLSGGIKLFLMKVVEQQKLPFEITAKSETDTLEVRPEVLDTTEKEEQTEIERPPVKTWNPFQKHSIG